jgi:hypothetical protein
LYDPAADQMLVLPAADPPVTADVLLDDGRVFGIDYRYSSADLAHSGTFAQIYTPPATLNPSPVIGSAISNNAPNPQLLTLDIHGSLFLPNTFVSLGPAKLVTLYLGARHLVAFVPSALRSSLSSGIVVNNPNPGGGQTTPVPVGFTATSPLPIPEVEEGTIRTGYVIVTPDPGSVAPVSTLTYGAVRNGIVQSQAAILPTFLTTESSVLVDVVRGIGRNVGLAIANSGATSAAITLTLRNEDGGVASSPISLSIPARGQIAQFVTELISQGAIGDAFRGSLTIQSSTPVSIVGLRFSGQEFSTIPIAVTNPSNVAQQGSIGGAAAVIFPQFAMSGGWATTIGLVNMSSTPIAGRIDIFDPNGNPLPVTWNGAQASSFNYSIPAKGSALLARAIRTVNHRFSPAEFYVQISEECTKQAHRPPEKDRKQRKS